MTREVLWTAADATRVTAGETNTDWQATGVSIDSRTLVAGDLFVAIRGPNFDGHDFVPQALRAGAAAVVISRTPPDYDPTAPRLAVSNTAAALDALACHARERSRARVICVTGSVGKTGTKEALALALGALSPTHASRGNLNNQWGLPLSLARLPQSAAYAVFELGMNHPGELSQLSRLARPHVAIVTTIHAVHLEFFDSVAAIADAKAEVFAGMGPDGTAVLNRDNAYFASLAAAAEAAGVGRVVGFGAHLGADARLLSYAANDNGGTVTAAVHGRELSYRLALPGRHWAINSLAVLATIDALDTDLERAAAALAGLVAPPGRGDRRTVSLAAGGTFELIDDSYNASPAALRAALTVLADIAPAPGGRRIAILGDMLELGATSRAMHTGLAGALKAAGVDLVLCAGAHMSALHDALPRPLRGGKAASAAALAVTAVSTIRADDVVLVKGSAGSRMSTIVAALSPNSETDAEPAPLRAANGE